MYDEEISYFKSEYDKNIILYGKQTIYEPLDISEEDLIREIARQKRRGLDSTRPCFGIKLGVMALTKSVVIIFERISFGVKDLSLIQKIMYNHIIHDEERIHVDAIFVNCQFATPIIINEPIKSQVCFKDCIFKRDIAIKEAIVGKVIFNKCKINERFDLENITIMNMLHIEESWFGKNSIVNFNNTKFNPMAKFAIKDTQFTGRFEAKNASLDGFTKLINISFMNTVDITGIKFQEHCIFDNIAFAHPGTQKVIELQKELAKSLTQSGCAKEIEHLGLFIQTQNDKENLEKYEIAIRTGWLKPSYAALFLGKSVSYLTQKRKKDKEMITRDSIPFTGVGKNIQYPVDALLAYKSKDWDKLKELRQKYKEIED